jgi:hypothetical protein
MKKEEYKREYDGENKSPEPDRKNVLPAYRFQ